MKHRESGNVLQIFNNTFLEIKCVWTYDSGELWTIIITFVQKVTYVVGKQENYLRKINSKSMNSPTFMYTYVSLLRVC